MDLSIFSTQIAHGVGKQTALSGSKTGVTAGVGGNADFWQVLFGNLLDPEAETNNNQNLSAEELKTKIKEKISESSLESIGNNFGKAIKGNKIDISLLKSILSSIDSPEGEVSKELGDLKIERLVDILGTFTNGVPQEDVHSYDTKKEEQNALSLSLLTSNLNPSDISKITERIEKVEAKLGRPLTIDDIVSGVGNIIPAPGDDNHEFSKSDFLGVLLRPVETEDQVVTLSKAEKVINNNDLLVDEAGNDINIELVNESDVSINEIVHLIQQGVSPDEIAQKLNELTVGENGKEQNLVNFPVNKISNPALQALRPDLPAQSMAPIKNPQLSTPLTQADGEILSEDALLEGENFIANLKKGNLQNGIVEGKVRNIGMATTAPLPQITPVQLHNMAFANVESDFFTQGFLSEDGFEYNLQTGTPFSSTMQAAHMTSMTSQAGQAHPATNMVAAHMTKAARNGDAQITLQLDPPELGRVEVRLEFGNDNSVKANLVVEKPETYMMLQRDNAALEKALQNAGLDTDSGSLNYEMASNDYFSNDRHDGRGNGQQTSSGSQSDNENDMETIESTMTWRVDPETGHMRYNILA